MKKILLTVLISVAALMTGCDEQARLFATQTKAILDQRSAQLSKKIAAEMESYNDYAAKAADDNHNLMIAALGNERAERANALAADYQEGRKPASLWREDLAEYANVDYERTKQLLMTDIDAETNYLQRYQSIAIEQDKVDALAKLLDAMAKKQSLKDEAGALVGFVEDTKQEFDEKVCSALESNTDAASKQLFKDKKCVPTPK
jgi:hypothetical protein